MLQLASEKCYPLCVWSSLYYDCDRDRDKCGPPCIIITIQLVIDKSDFLFYYYNTVSLYNDYNAVRHEYSLP